jgi:hypothetical protein
MSFHGDPTDVGNRHCAFLTSTSNALQRRLVRHYVQGGIRGHEHCLLAWDIGSRDGVRLGQMTVTSLLGTDAKKTARIRFTTFLHPIHSTGGAWQSLVTTLDFIDSKSHPLQWPPRQPRTALRGLKAAQRPPLASANAQSSYYAALRPLTGAAKYAWGARAR